MKVRAAAVAPSPPGEGCGGGERYRSLDQLGGQRLLADLMRDYAQQVQGERVIGRLLQYLLQQMFRFLQAPLRLKLRCQRHCLIDRKLRCLSRRRKTELIVSGCVGHY